MREQFEKLPEVARLVICDEIKWCDVYNWYRTDNTDANSIYHVAWLNGAWYVFQEQQKKIARLQSALDDLKEWAQDEKQKSLDSDLSEYNNAKYVMAALFVENINRIIGTDK